MSGSGPSSARARRVVPREKGTGSQQAVVRCPEQITPNAKQVPHETVYRHEALRVRGDLNRRIWRSRWRVGRCESSARLFSYCVVLVHDRGHEAAVGRRVAAQLVRHQTSWRTASPFQELPAEAFRRVSITPGLHQNVDHIAVLVDGPPEILLMPLKIDEEFVQVPGVAHRPTAAPRRARIRRPERATPLPHRLVGHGDAPLRGRSSVSRKLKQNRWCARRRD